MTWDENLVSATFKKMTSKAILKAVDSKRKSQLPSASCNSTVVCALNKECASELADIDLQCNVPPWTPKFFEQDFDNPASITYGARHKGEIVGFLVCHKVLDEAHIVNFGVRKMDRGKGVGRQLLSEVLERLFAEAFCWVTLEVRKGNHAAIALYESFGFSECGIREKYYSDNLEDGLILRLNLVSFAHTQKFGSLTNV